MATWAPTATNRQGWRFIIIDDSRIKQEIIDNGGAVIINNSPCVILEIMMKTPGIFDIAILSRAERRQFKTCCWQPTIIGFGACWVCKLANQSYLEKNLEVPERFYAHSLYSDWL